MDSNEQVTGLGRRLFYWWADRPAVHVLVLLSMTALAIVGYFKPSLIRDLFISPAAEETQAVATPVTLQNAGRNEQPPDVEPFQVAGGECIVVATCEDFFTQQSLTAIRNVVADLEALPQVSGVLWLDSIPGLNLFGLPESLLPRSNASPRQMQLGRERTLSNPLAIGQLISTDGKTLLLHLRMDWFYATTDEACTTDLRKTAEAATARVPGARL